MQPSLQTQNFASQSLFSAQSLQALSLKVTPEFAKAVAQLKDGAVATDRSLSDLVANFDPKKYVCCGKTSDLKVTPEMMKKLQAAIEKLFKRCAAKFHKCFQRPCVRIPQCCCKPCPGPKVNPDLKPATDVTSKPAATNSSSSSTGSTGSTSTTASEGLGRYQGIANAIGSLSDRYEKLLAQVNSPDSKKLDPGKLQVLAAELQMVQQQMTLLNQALTNLLKADHEQTMGFARNLRA